MKDNRFRRLSSDERERVIAAAAIERDLSNTRQRVVYAVNAQLTAGLPLNDIAAASTGERDSIANNRSVAAGPFVSSSSETIRARTRQ